jgi:very-short-patch-repair endonuclease
VPTEPVYEVSDFHRKVMDWIAARGLRYMEEVVFFPYRVDIYLPDLHAAVEADGMHGVDPERDRVLRETYYLHVAHVTPRLLGDEVLMERAFELFEELARTDVPGTRAKRCGLRAPWL